MNSASWAGRSVTGEVANTKEAGLGIVNNVM